MWVWITIFPIIWNILQGRKFFNLRKFQNETNFTGSLLEVNSKLYTFAENWNWQVWTKVSLIKNDIRLDFGNRVGNFVSSQISHGYIWESDQKAYRNVQINICLKIKDKSLFNIWFVLQVVFFLSVSFPAWKKEL